MSGQADPYDETPPKKTASGGPVESFTLTKDKVIGYANDIIKSIKDRLEQLDDPNAAPLDFGVQEVILSPTVQASFDMYGQATGTSGRNNELYMAQVTLQEEIDKNCKSGSQFCCQDSKPEEMTIIEAKITNYPSIDEQMNSLIACLNQQLRVDKRLSVKELVCDFVTDYLDDRQYFLQIKVMDTEPFLKPTALKPMFHKRKIQINEPKLHFDHMTKQTYECAGDYCDIEQSKTKELPPVHQELLYEILKQKDLESKKSNDMIIANLTSPSAQMQQPRKMPLNESYSYYIVQKTINKDRKITKKYPKNFPKGFKPSEGKFSTMFDRVRVCTLCFRIYKELENYYFKELRRNMAGDENNEGEETERLMNREVKNDKDDADPRMRVDKALSGLFTQVKKNMDKFGGDNTRSSSVGAKGKDILFKTLDPKSSQKDTLELSKLKKKDDSKLPPIGKKST